MSPIKNELILCTQTYDDTIDVKNFGNTIINQCTVNLTIFSKENYEMLFYQMYIKIQNTGEFREIPVMIDNFPLNRGTSLDFHTEDKYQRKLFKRFFLIHNHISGNSIVYARNITLKVELVNSREGVSQMYIPYLKIYYHFLNQNTQDLIAFVSDYYMDLNGIMKGCLAFLIICLVLIVIIVAARMYVWCILNPSQLTKESYPTYFLKTIIFKLFKYFGIIIFFFFLGY